MSLPDGGDEHEHAGDDMTRAPSARQRRAARIAPRSGRRVRQPSSFGRRQPADAPRIHALIEAHLEEGHLLPRRSTSSPIHASRFVVACAARRTPRVVGCAELAPLSADVAEVRSLVVDRSARALGIGRRLVDELQRQARRRRLREAVRLHARRRLLRAHGILDRPARVGARENRARLPSVRAVPALRPARRRASLALRAA